MSIYSNEPEAQKGDSDLFAQYKRENLLETADLYLAWGGIVKSSGYAEPACYVPTTETKVGHQISVESSEAH